MSSLTDFLDQKIARRSEEGLLRKLTIVPGLKDFSSNDYLGLAQSQELFNLIRKKTENFGPKFNGATGSRLLSGNSQYTEEVERKLAKIFKGESALLFNSGYAANQAALSSIPQKGDTIFYDELAHACIKDGARLSLAERHSFRHNDLNDLEKKIQRTKTRRIIIAVESIYSMDGDQCPLHDLVHLAEKYGASIFLDEAHSTGVMGEHGGGFAVLSGLENKIDVRVYTFGKAMGTHGACVVGSGKLREYLINFARPFIYTTALPPHSIVSIDCAFDYLHNNIGLQSILQGKIEVFRKSADFENKVQSNSAIQTAIFPGNERSKQVAGILQEQGFDVRPILSPTVPKETERVRICLHTYNTDEDISGMAKLVGRC
jgi:8-amino-7-oxononanoate synthase